MLRRVTYFVVFTKAVHSGFIAAELDRVNFANVGLPSHQNIPLRHVYQTNHYPTDIKTLGGRYHRDESCRQLRLSPIDFRCD